MSFRVRREQTFHNVKCTENICIPQIDDISTLQRSHKGALIFDKNTNVLHYSDGLAWRPLHHHEEPSKEPDVVASDVDPVTSANVHRLKPLIYKSVKTGLIRHGFSEHIQQIFPDLVNPKLKTIRYNDLVVLMLMEIQKLRKEVDSFRPLQSELESLRRERELARELERSIERERELTDLLARERSREERSKEIATWQIGNFDWPDPDWKIEKSWTEKESVPEPISKPDVVAEDHKVPVEPEIVEEPEIVNETPPKSPMNSRNESDSETKTDTTDELSSDQLADLVESSDDSITLSASSDNSSTTMESPSIVRHDRITEVNVIDVANLSTYVNDDYVYEKSSSSSSSDFTEV